MSRKEKEIVGWVTMSDKVRPLRRDGSIRWKRMMPYAWVERIKGDI